MKHVLSEPKFLDTHPLVTGQDSLPTYWFDWVVTGLNLSKNQMRLFGIFLDCFFFNQKNWPQCQQLNLHPRQEHNLKAQYLKIKM